MKSRISILNLIFLLGMAPALQANDTENSSWLAPLTNKTVLYSALGIASGYVAYKLYSLYTQSSDIEVIAPWQKKEQSEEIPVDFEAQRKTVDTLEQFQESIERYTDLFVSIHGPSLVDLNMQLLNPELEEADRKTVEYDLAQIEGETLPVKDSISLITDCIIDLLRESYAFNDVISEPTVTRHASYDDTLDSAFYLLQYMTAFVYIYNGNEYLNTRLQQEFPELVQMSNLMTNL